MVVNSDVLVEMIESFLSCITGEEVKSDTAYALISDIVDTALKVDANLNDLVPVVNDLVTPVFLYWISSNLPVNFVSNSGDLPLGMMNTPVKLPISSEINGWPNPLGLLFGVPVYLLTLSG